MCCRRAISWRKDNYNIVNAKYQQGAVSEFDKISAEVQMRSIKPNVISAGNAVTLSKLQLKVLTGVTADVDIEIADNLGNYETELFANELNQPAANLNNNTTMKQLDLNRKMLNQNIKSLRTNFMPTLGMNYSYQYQSLYNEDWNILDYNWSGSSALMFTLSIPLYKASNFTKPQVQPYSDTSVGAEPSGHRAKVEHADYQLPEQHGCQFRAGCRQPRECDAGTEICADCRSNAMR